MTRAAPLALAGAIALASPAARAQTMLDQEERLIDIHCLLLDLPPVQAPGALAAWQWSLGLEAIGIPEIDGTTGTKEQLTASDRTPVFPRPRVAVGLPAPEGFRAFLGASYVPPVRINEASTHFVAGEAGFAWIRGAFRAGIRAHALYADSSAPVTEANTRDTLETTEWGIDLSAGWSLALERARLELVPYAGAGVVDLHGRFRVTSDGYVLESDHTGPALHAGVRLLYLGRWEGVAEIGAYPDRLVHPSFRVGYVFR